MWNDARGNPLLVNAGSGKSYNFTFYLTETPGPIVFDFSKRIPTGAIADGAPGVTLQDCSDAGVHAWENDKLVKVYPAFDAATTNGKITVEAVMTSDAATAIQLEAECNFTVIDPNA